MFQQSPPVSCWAVSRHLSDTQGRCGRDPARHKITSLPSSWLLLKSSQGTPLPNETPWLWPHSAFRLLFSSLSSNKLIPSHLARTLILETSSSYFSNPLIFKGQFPPSTQRAFPDLSAAPSLPPSTLGCTRGWSRSKALLAALPGLQGSARLGSAPFTQPPLPPALLTHISCFIHLSYSTGTAQRAQNIKLSHKKYAWTVINENAQNSCDSWKFPSLWWSPCPLLPLLSFLLLQFSHHFPTHPWAFSFFPPCYSFLHFHNPIPPLLDFFSLQSMFILPHVSCRSCNPQENLGCNEPQQINVNLTNFRH